MKLFVQAGMLIVAGFVLAACDGEQPPKVETSSDDPYAVNVYAQWPQGKYLFDVPPAENVYGVNYVLAIDTSGSMEGSCSGDVKMAAAQAAAAEFLENIPLDAAVGLAVFGSQVGMLVPLQNDNHQAVREAIASLRPGGGTPMAQALEMGFIALSQAGSAQYGYGEYSLVVLGDGDPTNKKVTKKWLDYIAQQTPIRVTTIGFCADISVLDRVGVNYQPASNAEELKAAFASVLAETETFEGDSF